MKLVKIAVVIAHKTDDIELVAPVLIWRKMGYTVDLVTIEKEHSVILSSGLKVVCKEKVSDIYLHVYDLIYLPGGLGFKRFFNPGEVKVDKQGTLKLQSYLKRFISSPSSYIAVGSNMALVLKNLDVLTDQKVASDPDRKDINRVLGENFVAAPIYVHQNLISISFFTYVYDLIKKVVELLTPEQEALDLLKSVLND